MKSSFERNAISAGTTSLAVWRIDTGTLDRLLSVEANARASAVASLQSNLQSDRNRPAGTFGWSPLADENVQPQSR